MKVICFSSVRPLRPWDVFLRNALKFLKREIFLKHKIFNQVIKSNWIKQEAPFDQCLVPTTFKSHYSGVSAKCGDTHGGMLKFFMFGVWLTGSHGGHEFPLILKHPSHCIYSLVSFGQVYVKRNSSPSCTVSNAIILSVSKSFWMALGGNFFPPAENCFK